jgi:hypothetical protein
MGCGREGGEVRTAIGGMFNCGRAGCTGCMYVEYCGVVRYWMYCAVLFSTVLPSLGRTCDCGKALLLLHVLLCGMLLDMQVAVCKVPTQQHSRVQTTTPNHNLNHNNHNNRRPHTATAAT